MFERFTEPARNVVEQAQTSAREFRHSYIGTEHLLLGLLSVEGLAKEALHDLEVSYENAHAQVARIVGRGDEEILTGQIPFTPRAKKVLELALREALSLGHNYIGTEHILLGLVRENEGVAARILLDFEQLDQTGIRDKIIEHLMRNAPAPEASQKISYSVDRLSLAAAKVAIALTVVRDCRPDDEVLAAIALEIVEDIVQTVNG